MFNHRTDVDVSNRVVCYDIKELGKQLKKIGMLIVQDQVWNRVTRNREARKATRYYIDEFHLLLKEEQTAAYSVEIWKRFRKWGGIPTGITQNVKDLLASREVENIAMSVTLENFGKEFVLTMQGKLRYQADLGGDPKGNLIRLDNSLALMPSRMQALQIHLEEICHQQAAAKAEVGKPWPYEQELRDKTARLIFLDAELNLDANGQSEPEKGIAKSSRPSILSRLKSPPPQSKNPKQKKHHEEVR